MLIADGAGIGAAVALVIGLAVVLVLGWLPGKIAKDRGHPQAETIAILSWLGLFFSGGLLWIVALAWAHSRPRP